MDTYEPKDAAEALDMRTCSALPASFAILSQALADDAFEGSEVACFGDYSVSWNTRKNLVAIADSGGWWVMPASDLKRIAAATPNNRDDRLASG